MAAHAKDLTTLALMKAYGGIGGGADDTLIQEIITGVSVAMQEFCGRVITEVSGLVELHRMSGMSDTLVLDQYPATTITSVVEGTTSLASSAYQLVATPGGDTDRALIRLAGTADPQNWAQGFVTVTYTAGYAVANIPVDLRLSAERESFHAFHQSQPGGARLGAASKTSPTGDTIAYVPSGWLPETLEVLKRHRRVF